MTDVHIALVHHPVLDRGGAIVTTALTNLDLHDMARSARTYGVKALHIVHPVEAQRTLATRIRDHWLVGSGKNRIPDRADALAIVSITPSLADVIAEIGGNEGRNGVSIWTTAAASRGQTVTSYAGARAKLSATERPVLILFGTGWGLAPHLITDADLRIEPIVAKIDRGWNHLSVRAACAITLDRLFG